VLNALDTLAAGDDAAPATVALACLLATPNVVAALASARIPEQSAISSRSRPQRSDPKKCECSTRRQAPARSEDARACSGDISR
jgi:hypothetical protein